MYTILLQILKFFVNSFHVTSKSLSDFDVRIYCHLKNETYGSCCSYNSITLEFSAPKKSISDIVKIMHYCFNDNYNFFR